jgi:hypothetical protein
LVSPLPPAPWPLRSQRDNEIRDVLKRYAQFCFGHMSNLAHSQKYGHVPPKLVVMSPWQALCVDLIRQYTLKGKDGISSDFMCLTMIDPAMSWFEIVDLLTVIRLTVPTIGKGKREAFSDYTKESEMTFDKLSAHISNLEYKTWFSRYPCC